jgi:hypothetical protein
MGLFEGLGNMLGGFAAKAGAKRAMRRANKDKREAIAELKSLERDRQPIINPYSNDKDLSSLAKDLSGKLSNPFASLGVSTAAAEIQIEETDIALANTLDTLRATGAGAGGATALAQAALQSKKGVAASIEQQEAQNEKLRAQGQQQLERMELAEGQRIQGVQIGEGRRLQANEAAGRAFAFNALEKRQSDKIDYVRGEKDAAKYRELGSAFQKSSAIGQIWSGLGQAADGAQKQAAAAAAAAAKGISDRRLKKNIRQYGKSLSGINIYLFEYKDKNHGKGVYQGAMSDEVPSEAVIKNFIGIYDGVDYSKIDVEFKQI